MPLRSVRTRVAYGGTARSAIAAAYGGGAGNTGCAAAQVAIITERIDRLRGGHFGEHARDRHGYRGLQGLISKRRRLLSYLRKRSLIAYAVVVNRLGLRR